MNKRYEVSEDGQSVLDNRTHAAVPLPASSYAKRELVKAGFSDALALTLWAESLNS